MNGIGAFKYEDDLLKHYVRINGWLPLCEERRRRLGNRPARRRRRLRYFTFCAVNAVDVLMLDVARVLRQSSTNRFDTVCFFDRTPDLVAETQLRIPGARGFYGSFVDTVLAPDIAVAAPLAPPPTDQDTREVRDRQRVQATRQEFKDSFPYDVLNLDLEDLIFRAHDTIPGDVIRAFKRVCEWQRRPVNNAGQAEHLEGFTFLFTTRIGPAQLRQDYADMLLGKLRQNVQQDGGLVEVLQARTGLDVEQLMNGDFRTFFEIGVPKVLANVLIDEDWQIEEDPGVLAFRFTRPGTPPLEPYDILHFAMNVRRQNPRNDQREPGTTAPDVAASYRTVSRRLFENASTQVTDDIIDVDALRPSLDEIKSRRRKYYPDDMA